MKKFIAPLIIALSLISFGVEAQTQGGGGGGAPSTTLTGDCTGTGTGTISTTCTKTNGTSFGALATVVPGTGVATALASNLNGSGAPVATTSPSLVTPVLGTPSSGNASNLTNIPVANATGLLAPANGGSGVANTGNLTWASGGGAAALLGGTLPFTAPQVLSAAGAASTPGLTVSGAPYTGGSTSSNFPQIYLNSGATGPTTFSASGTVFGINAPSGFAGNFMGVYLNGSSALFTLSSTGALFSAANISTNASLSAGSSSTITWASRGILSSPAAGTVQLGNTDAAAPVAQTLSAQSVVAGTSNTAGANETIQGSRGTGTGIGGDIIFSAAPAGTTGTSQNAAQPVLTISHIGVIIPKGFTVATLPAGASQGSIAFVTDAVACTFLASLTGGGSTYCPVTYSGSAWVGG